jgi:protein-tyrosine phosphatase
MELFWVNDVLALATRPRGGDWLRDDLADLGPEGVRTVVSCLTHDEELELGLEGESEAARAIGLEFLKLPITDQGTPDDGVVEKAVSWINSLSAPLGKVAIHCRQALGRSPLVAAAVLVQRGMTATAAWETVARARGRSVPETEEQRLWLVGFAARQNKRLAD